MLKQRTNAIRAALVAAAALLIAAIAWLLATARIETAHAAAADFTVTTSSDIKSEDGSYHPSYLYDNNINTSWLAAWQNEHSPVCDEWVLLDFGSVVKVDSITLYRHYDGTSFPADFTLDWSVRGTAFETVAGFSMTGYAPADGDFSGEKFRLNTVTRFVRIHVTKRSPNPEGYYVLAISEIKAEVSEATAAEIEDATVRDGQIVRRPVVDDAVIQSTATASSHNNSKDPNTGAAMWSVSHINDGTTATQWCADWGSGVDSEECDEWITLTFPSPQYVTGMTINSQVEGHYGFPKNFRFEWTLDGENFYAVTGATYENESTQSMLHVKAFETPVVATAIRMSITACHPDTMGNYVPQLAELQAHGRAATEDEVNAATATFNKLNGEAAQAKTVLRDKDYSAASTAFLVFGIIAAAGVAACAALVTVAYVKSPKKEEKAND